MIHEILSIKAGRQKKKKTGERREGRREEGRGRQMEKYRYTLCDKYLRLNLGGKNIQNTVQHGVWG